MQSRDIDYKLYLHIFFGFSFTNMNSFTCTSLLNFSCLYRRFRKYISFITDLKISTSMQSRIYIEGTCTWVFLLIFFYKSKKASYNNTLFHMLLLGALYKLFLNCKTRQEKTHLHSFINWIQRTFFFANAYFSFNSAS